MALIGPNGAGKTTLLRLLTGLSRPTGGEVAVLGGTPRQHPAFLADVGFLAQEIPLYRRFTAADHIAIGAHLNPRWDAASARQRLTAWTSRWTRRQARCPAGKRAQLALALTLAKQPRLLLLDEPVAALDPLARRHFLATLADAVAAGGLTVMLSSHLVADLERVCDHLILLSASRVQLCGDIDDPARRASGPGRPAQGHHRDRENAHPGSGRAHCPPDHPAAAAKRPGDRPRLRGRRRQPRRTGARLHGPERRRPPTRT